MKCHRVPGAIFCGPDAEQQHVTVNGRIVYFDFDRQFGPLLTDKNGEPLKLQPVSDRHPFWPPFERWLKAWLEANPEPSPPPGPGAHLDRRAS